MKNKKTKTVVKQPVIVKSQSVQINQADKKSNMSWQDLESKYGKSQYERTFTILKEYNKLIGTHKRLIKPPEPLLLMQFKNGVSEWFSGVTQGVFEYKGSDGKDKKIWVSLKYLSTMKWGEDTVRYYNCSEDMIFPNGLQDTDVTADDVEKILIKQDLNHEKLKAKELEAQGSMFWNVAKGIGLIIFCIVGAIVLAKMFGVDIITAIKTTDAINQTISNITNTTNSTITSLGTNINEQIPNITIVR